MDELFFLRTDDVPPSDALKVLVMSPTERKVVDKLKNRTPIVLSFDPPTRFGEALI